jgi:hypothetical protein
MADEAGTAVKKKIGEVESEQGGFKEAGAEPKEDWGHGSAPSKGVAGNKIPGGNG